MSPRIFSWNPRPYLFDYPLRRLLPFRRGEVLNNFGDLLGPIVVQHMLELKGVKLGKDGSSRQQLLSVGSVMHFAKDGDIVWGTGVNGKKEPSSHKFSTLDVRSVRGPLTREFLHSKGIACPEVYGDPGLLVPDVFPHLRDLSKDPEYDLTVIPNLNDIDSYQDNEIVDPRRPVLEILERIAGSRFVTGSSLHAIVIAESLGIPARLVVSQNEHTFKYEDYYAGTGRPSFTPAATPRDAVKLGGEPRARVDTAALRAAFPYDLWI